MIGSEALAREIKEFPFAAVVQEWEETDWYRWREAGYPDDETPFKVLRTSFETDYSILPEGWRFLARGCSRSVFLGPDGVCYKLMNDIVGGDVYRQTLDVSQNFSEAYVYATKAFAVLQSSGGRSRLARCHYFYDLDVLAMEHSERVAPCSDFNTFYSVGFQDVHDGNMWDDDRGTVMVDYAI